MDSTPVLGPVEFLVLSFPGTAIDATITDALAQVVGDGLVTLIDLIVLSMDDAGAVTELEIDDDLNQVGLTGLTAAALLTAGVVLAGLAPGLMLAVGRTAAAGLLDPTAYIAATGLGGAP